MQWNQWKYEYDAHGNVITRGTGNSNKQTYRYDGDNRLTLAEGHGMKAIYHYDALGRRIRRVVTTMLTERVNRVLVMTNDCLANKGRPCMHDKVIGTFIEREYYI
ncbi:hypothetical protein [Xenorhabdus bovienii]|uniref:hypothetical protein n=1 Tax=Xenorhabdus bovienii TaxID=40576 RepID=UPI003DA460B3